MLETLKALVQKDDDLPERAYTHDWRRRFFDGSIYKLLKHEFWQEQDENNKEYVPLRKRRPSSRLDLCGIIVNDSVSFTLSESHFPGIECGQDDLEQAINDFVKQARVRQVMMEAAGRGSIGSVFVLLRILKEKPYVESMWTRFLTPTWKKDAPDELEKVVEKYKVDGKALIAMGYDIPDKLKSTEFWFQRDWNSTEELWYMPWPVKPEEARTLAGAAAYALKEGLRDEKRTVKHDLGFVPGVWIRNLPGPTSDKIDGQCTFEKLLENAIEIDYLLSQVGRGFKYSMDPTLHITEPAYQDMEAKDLVKGAANAIVTSPEATATLLEISGAAYAHATQFIDRLRELGLENCSGNRASPDKMASVQSGRAMEILNYALIALADKLRTSYGEEGLLPLYRLLIKANDKFKLRIGRKKTYEIGALSALEEASEQDMALKWPDWYPVSPADRAQHSTALATLRDAGLLSQETGVKSIQHDFDVEDADAEIKRIKSEREDEARLEAERAKATAPFEYGRGGKTPQAA